MAFNSSVSPFITAVPVANDASYQMQASQNLTATNGLITVNNGAGGTFAIQPTGALQGLANLTTVGLLVQSLPNGQNGIITARVESNGSLLVDDSGALGGNVTVSVVPNTTQQLLQAQVNGTNVYIPVRAFNFVNGDNTTFEGTANGNVTNITCNVANVASSSIPVITTQDDPSLTNATNLGIGESGVLYATVGVDNIAQVATTLSPVMNGTFINDGTIAPQKVIGTAVNLTSAQSISGQKTFTSKIVAANAQFTTSPANGAVWTSDASGNGSWQLASSGAYWSTLPALQNVNMGGYRLTNVADPIAAQDAVTLAFVQASIKTPFTASTANATPTAAATIAVASNTSVTITGSLIGKNDAHNDSTGGRFMAVAMNNGGTLTLLGAPEIACDRTSTGSFDIVLSGTNLIVQVTGIAQNYSWSGSYSLAVI